MNIPFSPETIKTELDIKDFFVWLVNDQFLSFHCDTPFEDYVNYHSGERIYTDEEASKLDILMDRCFELHEDVYQIGMEVIKEHVFPEMGIEYSDKAA